MCGSAANSIGATQFARCAGDRHVEAVVPSGAGEATAAAVLRAAVVTVVVGRVDPVHHPVAADEGEPVAVDGVVLVAGPHDFSEPLSCVPALTRALSCMRDVYLVELRHGQARGLGPQPAGRAVLRRPVEAAVVAEVDLAFARERVESTACWSACGVCDVVQVAPPLRLSARLTPSTKTCSGFTGSTSTRPNHQAKPPLMFCSVPPDGGPDRGPRGARVRAREEAVEVAARGAGDQVRAVRVAVAEVDADLADEVVGGLERRVRSRSAGAAGCGPWPTCGPPSVER